MCLHQTEHCCSEYGLSQYKLFHYQFWLWNTNMQCFSCYTDAPRLHQCQISWRTKLGGSAWVLQQHPVRQDQLTAWLILEDVELQAWFPIWWAGVQVLPRTGLLSVDPMSWFVFVTLRADYTSPQSSSWYHNSWWFKISQTIRFLK